MKYVTALVLAASAVSGATKLLFEHVVGEWTFCFLILVSVFVGIWVAYSDRVREFTLSVGKLTMVLDEIRGKQREVEASERAVKKLAKDVVALVDQLEKSAIVDHTFDQAAFEKAKDEVKKSSA
jgi:hypothetical protein